MLCGVLLDANGNPVGATVAIGALEQPAAADGSFALRLLQRLDDTHGRQSVTVRRGGLTWSLPVPADALGAAGWRGEFRLGGAPDTVQIPQQQVARLAAERTATLDVQVFDARGLRCARAPVEYAHWDGPAPASTQRADYAHWTMATADADGHARLVVAPGTLLLSMFVRGTEVRATQLVEVGHGVANAVTLRLP